MKLRRFCLLVLLTTTLAFAQQNKSAPKAEKDIDPHALELLKTATEPIRAANNYSFRALVGREHLGTNGQIVTIFHVSEITVGRPDKLHMNFLGHGKEVQLFYNAGSVVLYTPEEKLFTSLHAPRTIDATLDDLEKRDVFLAMRNFLQSDPYKSLTEDVQTAYVVGMVMLFDQPVYHLAFTETNAEWQMWVIGGDKPQVRRMQVVDKSKAYLPRTTVDFLDWNLNAKPSADAFTFNKPADAKEIQMLKQQAQGKKP